MKQRERNLLILLVVLAVVLSGLFVSQRLIAWQKKIVKGEDQLRLAEVESDLLMAEEAYWRECSEWLEEKQPSARSELQANQELLDTLRNSAGNVGLDITKTQIEPVVEENGIKQFGVTLTVKGALPKLFRWMHSRQSPGAFYAVPIVRIASDKDNIEQVTAQVQFLRWYGKGETIKWPAIERVPVGQQFVTPVIYPVQKYEGGWNKNPFTLKTVPIPVERESFAKDFVLYNSYSIGERKTVILANVKTRERVKLTGESPAANGMILKNLVKEGGRKDSYAEVEWRGETALLYHDESFLKQMGAMKPESQQKEMMNTQKPLELPPSPAASSEMLSASQSRSPDAPSSSLEAGKTGSQPPPSIQNRRKQTVPKRQNTTPKSPL